MNTSSKNSCLTNKTPISPSYKDGSLPVNTTESKKNKIINDILHKLTNLKYECQDEGVKYGNDIADWYPLVGHIDKAILQAGVIKAKEEQK